MNEINWLKDADRQSEWSQAKVVVAGIGSAGYASADALLELGAKVSVLDDSDNEINSERAKILEALDAEVRLGKGASSSLPDATDLLIVSPGWRPDYELLRQAKARGIPIWGDVELAWRLMFPDRVVPWLAVTGTNGKTTTIQMLDSILRAAGLSSAAVGNIGRPIIEALNDETSYDVLAVELSSFQLHYCHSLKLHSAAVLNLHQDHLEWYEPWVQPVGQESVSDAAMVAYGQDKAKIYHQISHSCVYNVADKATEKMVADADVIEGARAIGFTLGIPGPSMLGVVDDILVDRAFIANRQSSALPLADLADVHPNAPHNIENALAASALARSFGVSSQAVKKGLAELQLGGHRIAEIAYENGIRWVDDSKATNPHAANSAMRAFDSIVWIAGGQTKRTSFDQLIEDNKNKIKAAVLIGVDRQVIADAISRHAPAIPVIVIDREDTGAMAQAVGQAAKLASPGDTVLLAPGAASRDMWTGYERRGEDFAKAVEDIIRNGQQDI